MAEMMVEWPCAFGVNACIVYSMVVIFMDWHQVFVYRDFFFFVLSSVYSVWIFRIGKG